MFKEKKIQLYFLAPILVFIVIALYGLVSKSNLNELTLNSGCIDTKASFIQYKKSDNLHKISYCSKGEKDIYKIETPFVEKKDYISFEYIGNPRGPNVSIYLEDENSNKYEIKNLKIIGSQWIGKVIKTPKELKGKIKIIAEDNSTVQDGWVGIGRVFTSNNYVNTYFNTYFNTIIYTFIFSILISLITIFFYNKNLLKSYIYMSLFLGIASLVVFFISLASLKIANYFSISMFLFAIYSLYKINIKKLNILMFLFTIISSLMIIILFIGYSDTDSLSNLQAVSANRWHHLPADDWIPKFFADAIFNGHINSPLFGSWLSSDRPPLQVGFFLIFSIFSSSNLMYLVSAVGMQLLVIIFIFLFILEYMKDSRYTLFFMILVFFNGFVFVHSLFVWPKLLSALYQGVAFCFLYYIWLNKSIKKLDFILFGLATILAFLSHGGSVFYLLGLYLLLLIYVVKKSYFKGLFYSVITAVIVYLPWVYYQKFIDPPGDRLLKWHLAAQVSVTKEPFLNVLINYYSNMKLSYWVDLQISHLIRIFYSFYLQLPSISSLTHGKFLNDAYFNLDYALLFFSIFLLPLYFIVRKKLNIETKLLLKLLIASYFLYITIWSLLLASGTVIHQGAYFPWFVGLMITTYIVYRFNIYLFYILGFLNLLVFITVYIKPYIFGRDILIGVIIIFMSFIYIYTIYNYLNNRKVNE